MNISIIAASLAFLSSSLFLLPPYEVDSLEAALENPEKVTHIRLLGEDITALPEEITKLVNLESFYLSLDNGFTTLPEYFSKLSNLQELNINATGLVAIAQNCSGVVLLAF